MNTDVLLAHFNRISEAPDAIPRLRQFILDLAVRGKLVEQRDSDEPATQALERTTSCNNPAMPTKKDSGVDKKSSSQNEQFFQLPTGWAWVPFHRLTREANVGIDRGRSMQGPTLRYAYFKMNNIRNSGGIDVSEITRIDARKDEVETFTLSNGDFLFNTRNSRELVGKTCVFRAWSDGPVLYNNNILRVRFHHGLDPDLFDFWFRSPQGKAEIEKLKSNTTNVCAIYQGKLASFPCPVPPFAEQSRIVAKVSELMLLCDRLEASQRKSETCREQLTASIHHHLNDEVNSGEFRARAQFFIGHLPDLSTLPSQIKELRQTILNLAVRGKLVSQNAGDQAPHEMLSSVAKRRKDLVAEGKLRSIGSIPAVSVASPFILPNNWEWTFPDQLSNLASNALTIGPFGSNLVTSDYAVSGTPLVFVSDIRSEFAEAPKRHISSVKAAELKGHSTGPGDLLITKMGDPPGDTAIYPANRPRAVITADCIKWSLEETLVLARYLYFAIRAPLIAGQITEITKGAAHQKVSLKRFRGIYLPLPPLSEQHRIVAKISELMTICDRLEARLTSAQTNTNRLLEAVLHHALSENSQLTDLNSEHAIPS